MTSSSDAIHGDWTGDSVIHSHTMDHIAFAAFLRRHIIWVLKDVEFWFYSNYGLGTQKLPKLVPSDTSIYPLSSRLIIWVLKVDSRATGGMFSTGSTVILVWLHRSWPNLYPVTLVYTHWPQVSSRVGFWVFTDDSRVTKGIWSTGVYCNFFWLHRNLPIFFVNFNLAQLENISGPIPLK